MFYSILSKIYPDGKMITVGTPGLGVRHPHGSNPGGAHVNEIPSKRFSIRLTDAQTGRPYGESIPSKIHWDGNNVLF
jgi:hypothetical protein